MLWCDTCQRAFPEDTAACPLCGGPLLAMADLPETPSDAPDGNPAAGWPQGPDGQPVAPAFLTKVMGLEMDYELALARLRAYHIPYVCQFPNAGSLVRIITGFSGAGMDIYVPETLLEDAQNIMQNVEE